MAIPSPHHPRPGSRVPRRDPRHRRGTRLSGRHHRFVAVVVLALAVAACSRTDPVAGPVSTAPLGSGTAVDTNATVTRVTDGDTIHVQRNGRDETIRLIGIDTPETKKPNTPVECFGTEASAHLKEVLPVGTAVRLERDAEERDTYDRTLAYVYRADGLFVNLAMAADGYAGQLTIPPNVAHADELGAAARAARQQDKGLWAACGGNHVAPRS
jgi:micrococcal nuclease